MARWTYYHTLDPFLIQITETFGLRWYSLAYILGAVSTWFFAVWFIKKGRLSLPVEKVWDIIAYGAIGAVVGGRLGYCIFYRPELFTDFDSRIPFWGVLKIYEGGMASHGGIIGLFVALLLFSRKYKLPIFSLTDLAVLGGSTGIFLGRIANFINGELYGRVIQTKALIGVKFPTELFLWQSDVSVWQDRLSSLYSVLPALKKVIPSGNGIPSPAEWGEWVYRAMEEPLFQNKVSHICHLMVKFSTSPSVQAALEPLLSLRHPSQLYQSLMGGLGPLIIIGVLWLKPRKAGIASLAWAFSYMIFRVISEFFRMPDEHIGYQFLSLTRGQWLSVSGFVLAVICAVAIYRQPPKGFSSVE